MWIYTSDFSLLGDSCLGGKLTVSPLRACPAFFILPSPSPLSLSTIAVKFDSSKCKLILSYRSPSLNEAVNLSNNTSQNTEKESLFMERRGFLFIFFFNKY